MSSWEKRKIILATTKKVLIVAHIDDPFSGGGQCVLSQCKALKKMRLGSVTLFKDTELASIIRGYGITVHIVPNLLIRPIAWLKFFFLFLYSARQESNIIHTHTERTSILLNPIFRILQLKVVTTLHRSLLHGSPWGGIKGKVFLFLESLTLRFFTNTIVSVSSSLKDELLLERGINPKSVVVVYNAVPFRYVPPKNNSKKFDDIHIISILRFAPEKGYDYFLSGQFLDFCSSLKRPIRLSLLGDGKLRGEFAIKASCLYKNFDIRLNVPGIVSDVHSWLSEADIYFQPSRSEAFGLGLIEASCHSIPIVTSDLPVFTEIMLGYAGHYSIACHGRKNLNVKQKHMLKNAIMRKRVGERFYWKVYPYPLERHERELEKIYEKLEIS